MHGLYNVIRMFVKSWKSFIRVLLSIFSAIFTPLLPIHAKAITVTYRPIGVPTDSTLTIDFTPASFQTTPNTSYNHSMARLAALLSEISYSEVEKTPFDNPIADVYHQLGAKDEDIEFHYALDYEDVVFGNDQCAFSIASAWLPPSSTGEKRRVVYLVIRGTPLNSNEWTSNLNIADSMSSTEMKTDDEITHEGWLKAAGQIRQTLHEYIHKRGITVGKDVLFITGHSRGGSVANLLSAAIADEPLADDPGCQELTSQERTRRIYTYTIACPNVTMKTNTADSRYGFIWNIINAEDIVPTIPYNHGNWHFTKYGNTKAFVNAWSCDSREKYEQDILPRINVWYNKIWKRDYFPFHSGTFVQIQLAEKLTSLNPNVNRFYNGMFSLHGIGNKTLTKIMKEPQEADLQSENNNPLYDFIAPMVDKMHEGMSEFIPKALNDMHACGTYLSHLAALDESECFSDRGSMQIVIRGTSDAAVTDKDHNVLATISNGKVNYPDSKLPILAWNRTSGTVAIGFPTTQDYTVYLAHESLIPTAITVSVEKYDACGILTEKKDKQKIYPARWFTYELEAGRKAAQEDDLVIWEIYGPEEDSATAITRAARREEPKLLGEVSFDSDLFLKAGIRYGRRPIYGELFFSTGLTHLNNAWALGVGFGTTQDLWGPIILDLGTAVKAVIIKDAEPKLNFVPQLQAMFSYRPVRRFSVFVAATADLHLDGLNDCAFCKDYRQITITEQRPFSSLGIVPAFQIGIRF